MYIVVNNIDGEKTIDLSYPIKQLRNEDGGKKLNNENGGAAEIAVVSLFSDNVQYKFENKLSVEDKMIEAKTYTRRELLDHMEGNIEMTSNHSVKKNALEGLTEIVLSLNELDNTLNLETDKEGAYGKPSRTLLTYYVTSNDDFTNFVPHFPQYKKLKNEEFINSLTLRITHKKSNIVVVENNRPKMTVVLHVR